MPGVTLRIAPHVRRTLQRGGAVVALESTVLTHGLPRPRNARLAHDLEEIVRQAGAVPATVGLIGGELTVGLSSEEIDHLAAGGADKASPWNLGALAARGSDAGTTVATTLHAAAAAGIFVFATGGIGGVHTDAFDESADLTALARHPGVTVCAGPKSILDARATLERLETLGVPVVGYRSDHLAGFHVPQTQLPLAARADDVDQVAAIARAQAALGLAGGVVVSNPVSEGLDADELARWLDAAHADAHREGIHGKATTPFLLERLAERSGGRTVDVNVRLLEENAALAVQIAHASVAGPSEVRA